MIRIARGGVSTSFGTRNVGSINANSSGQDGLIPIPVIGGETEWRTKEEQQAIIDFLRAGVQVLDREVVARARS